MRAKVGAYALLGIIVLIALAEIGQWISLEMLPIAGAAWIIGLCASAAIGLVYMEGKP